MLFTQKCVYNRSNRNFSPKCKEGPWNSFLINRLDKNLQGPVSCCVGIASRNFTGSKECTALLNCGGPLSCSRTFTLIGPLGLRRCYDRCAFRIFLWNVFGCAGPNECRSYLSILAGL